MVFSNSHCIITGSLLMRAAARTYEECRAPLEAVVSAVCEAANTSAAAEANATLGVCSYLGACCVSSAVYLAVVQRTATYLRVTT